MSISISKNQLKELYENQKLTTFKIADKIGCCQATIWKKLKEFDIKRRLPGIERVNLTKEQLNNLYLKRNLSTWEIEKQTGIPRGTVHRKLKEFGLKIRDRAESHIIYPRKDFSGNPSEKSYLIGFRIGDLGVRKIYKNSKTICVASGSTKKEQISLIKSLFEDYGNVWIKKKNEKINIQVSLNESFYFLLNKTPHKRIFQNKKTFFTFLAGFTDAEGNIGIYNKMARYQLGNYNKELLYKIASYLKKYGIKCNDPTSDKRKGKLNSEGYKYNSNYWSLSICNKKNLMKLLEEIKPHIKHENKMEALNKAVDNLNQRNRRKDG